jgi:hypothetical protein
MLISETYKALNKQLHGQGNYGISGSRWGEHVRKLSQAMNTRDILDYGCGNRTLEQSLGFPIRNYDPCIQGLDATPSPAQIVACTDVLEHVEPDYLDAVLDDLQRCVISAGFFVIANRPARKVLPDGRNAHLIQEGPRWWLPKLCQRFEIVNVASLPGEFVVVVKPAQANAAAPAEPGANG